MAEIVKSADKLTTIRELIKKNHAPMQAALGKFMPPEQFAQIAFTSIRENHRLADCDPFSLVGAIIKSAQLRLTLDGVLGHAFLIPRRRHDTWEANFQVGSKGLRELALRSGKVSWIKTDSVKKGDTFTYDEGAAGSLRHVKPLDKPRGVTYAYYALARLRDGSSVFKVMSRFEVEEIRDRFSDAYTRDPKSSPWAQFPDAMGEKTVLIRLCDFLPMTADSQSALGLERLSEAGMPQNLEALVGSDGVWEVEGPITKAPSKLDTLADALEANGKTNGGKTNGNGHDHTPAVPAAAVAPSEEGPPPRTDAENPHTAAAVEPAPARPPRRAPRPPTVAVGPTPVGEALQESEAILTAVREKLAAATTESEVAAIDDDRMAAWRRVLPVHRTEINSLVTAAYHTTAGRR